MGIASWIAGGLTVLALIYTGIVFVGNKGSLHNFMDPGADFYLIGAWLIVVCAWAFAFIW